MLAVCRSGWQRVQLAAVALLLVVIVMVVLQPQLGPAVPPAPAAFLRSVDSRQWTSPPTVVRVPETRSEPQPGSELAPKPGVTAPPANATTFAPRESLQRVCAQMQHSSGGLAPDVRHVMRWVCEQVGGAVPLQLNPIGCSKAVRYHPIGRLGNLMGLYAIVYSFGRMYGATGYVDNGMWSTLHKYFPDISLAPASHAPSDTKWEDITYQQAKAKLKCQPGEGAENRFYRITNYPDRNGIDVFHPFYEDIRKEFTFSAALQKQAQEFLRYACGNRSSVTYIGFHVRRTDYQAYIHKAYNGSLPDDAYFNKTLTYYRERFPDALFIVCSDDLNYVAKQLKAKQNDDIVIAGNRNINDPGRDMALLSACNHSVVTVGTYGFWGAYLAGGTVLVPEQQTHLSRGDRHAPLLEIQLAGATNWLSMRR